MKQQLRKRIEQYLNSFGDDLSEDELREKFCRANKLLRAVLEDKTQSVWKKPNVELPKSGIIDVIFELSECMERHYGWFNTETGRFVALFEGCMYYPEDISRWMEIPN